MLDVALYFLRQKKLYLFVCIFSVTSLYSYFLALYFLDLSPLAINTFNLLTLFSLLGFIFCYMAFSKHKEQYTSEREKEKYKLLRHQTILKYNLDAKDNIFSKIDLIVTSLHEKFSSKGLLNIRILKIANTSLSLYIENLKIKEKLSKALSLSSDLQKKEFYNKEIEKNMQQNGVIEEGLDNLIKELMSKNNNDKKVENILNEFEHSTQILAKITQH